MNENLRNYIVAYSPDNGNTTTWWYRILAATPQEAAIRWAEKGCSDTSVNSIKALFSRRDSVEVLVVPEADEATTTTTLLAARRFTVSKTGFTVSTKGEA